MTLVNGTPLFFDFSPQFVILHLLISVCNSKSLSSPPNLFHCLGWLHSVWLFRGHNLSFLIFFYGDRLSACHPTPRHRVPIFFAFYDLHGLQWDNYFRRSPHGESLQSCRSFMRTLYNFKSGQATSVTGFPALCSGQLANIRDATK